MRKAPRTREARLAGHVRAEPARRPWWPDAGWAWLVALVACVSTLACRPQSDGVPADLRDRLKQEARLSDEDVARVRDEIGKRLVGRALRVSDDTGVRTLDEAQRGLLLEILNLPAGVYDEGVRREGAETLRVLNGPARSDSAEIEAVQRLWVDVDTLLPVRYEHAYALPGYGEDRRLDIIVEREREARQR